MLKIKFHLRYLQTLNSISAENNTTIIFPIPIDIMSNFMKFNKNKTTTKTTPKQGHNFEQFQHSRKQNLTPEIPEPTTTKYNTAPNQVRIEHFAP